MPKLYFILLVLLAATACQKKEDPRFAAIDNYFKKQFPDNEPGGAVLIMKNDSLIFSNAYGLADLDTKERITTKTLFNIGSISKTFVSNAILILQERGKLSVDDSPIKYFPDFKNKDIAAKVKIKHLLTHTSGLPDIRQVGNDTVFYLTAKDAENWYPITQTDTLEFEPGSQYNYSNPAFNGLALIVEQVSGMKWQKFVEENIFKPSGMATSTITDGDHPNSGVSHGYVKNGNAWIEDDYGEEPTFCAAGNGGVWSSVEELAAYERAIRKRTFLGDESIVNSRSIKKFPNWTAAYEPFVGWSWHFWMHNQKRLVGHSGSQGGFLANYVYDPASGIFFVILCNAPREPYEMRSSTEFVLRKLANL